MSPEPKIHQICPGCKARLPIPGHLAGKKVRCSNCKATFVAHQLNPWLGSEPPRPLHPLVFISHDHDDRDFVEKHIKPLLESHGVQTWWSHEIRVGDRWFDALQQGLRQSDWFLVVMSRRSENSPWVKDELRTAMENRRERIIPVLIEPCVASRFHPNLPDLQAVDFTRNPGEAGKRIVTAMLRQLNKEARGHQEKVEHLTQELEAKKEEALTLHNREEALQDQLDSILEFDGNWGSIPVKNAPPVRPLEPGKPPIVAIANLKGGVGKTTLTANIGAFLWSQTPKQRVLLVDLDYQGSLTSTCLAPDARQLLRDQHRLVHEILALDAFDVKTLIRCTDRIQDDKDRVTTGHIVGADAELAAYEVAVLSKWLAKRRQHDIRFLLRGALHAPAVQASYDFILLDCPPRLTTACVNALTACDYLLIPVLLDMKSTEGIPILLNWLEKNRSTLFPNLRGVGIVANKTRGDKRDPLVARESERWEKLPAQCKPHWSGPIHFFETVFPVFTEAAMVKKFPAAYAVLEALFSRFTRELKAQLQPQAAKALS